MPLYKCEKCSATDDEAVPCLTCGRMLLPVLEERPEKRVVPVKSKKGAKNAA
jgi:hypothetical protein